MQEELAEFFLELAHEDRLRALFLIEKERLKLTHFSEKLNLSIQEASRHLSRLRDAKLIARDSDGFYCLTPLGLVTLRLVPSYSFILKNRDYFQDHDLSWLPPEFIERIGELEEYELGEGVMQVLDLPLVVMRQTKEYVWILADQVMTSIVPMIGEGFARGIRFRVMLPEKLSLPSGFQFPKLLPNSSIEIRRLEEVRACVIMNEALAGLCLPNFAGKVDFNVGFRSRNPKFHKWCGDLFLHYWERGRES
nr:hypothetical protein [Candidatus Njordarchaeota archaeon]